MAILETFQNWWTQYNPAVLNFVVALAFLLGFYIVARIVRGIVCRVMKKSTLDNKLVETLGVGEDFPIEKVVSGVFFWVILAFGLLSFFDRLELDIVAQPINTLLSEVMEYLPKLGAALGLSVIAWIVATLVKVAITKVAEIGKVDERLHSLDEESEEKVAVSHSLATAAYWFIFLLFLPLILGALQMESLVTPLQDMFSKVFTYLPNIFSAAIIFIIGNFVGRIVRKVISSLLLAAGVDGVGQKVGLQQSISGLLGTLAYTVILLLVIVQSLDALQIEAISAPAKNMVNIIFTAVPGILSAVLVLGISYYIGKLLSGLVADLLASAGFNQLMVKVGMPEASAEETNVRTPSRFVGQLVLIGVMLFAVLGATELVGFEPLSAIVSALIEFAFQVVLAAIILIVGILIAGKVAEIVGGASSYGPAAHLAKAAILILASAMALRQLGLAEDIINLAFGIMLGAVGLGAAIAIGLGSKEVAGREVESLIQRIKQK
ncbi:MAG: mechanosensitive ion channel [Cellvibrionaceae bacterium]